MKLISLKVGLVDCNCYILACERTNEGVVIDCGGNAMEVVSLIKENNLQIKHILCTHGHFDHLQGLSELRKHIDAPISIHENDHELYLNMKSQGAFFDVDLGKNPPCSHFLKDNEEIKFGDHIIKVIHTPGHTQGGVCFLTEGMLFSGDTLFFESIGRTDLPGGNFSQLISSIKNRLFALPEETTVFPGHEIPTTIKFEKKHNLEIPK